MPCAVYVTNTTFRGVSPEALASAGKTPSPEQKHDDQDDQPDGQRADEERNNREDERDVGEL
jgi:hypothetical protein